MVVPELVRLNPGNLVVMDMDELLDEMAAMAPPVDLNLCFARPLPRRMICGMLGVPIEDRGKFDAWTERILSFNQEYTAEEMAAAGVATAGLGLAAAVFLAGGDRPAGPKVVPAVDVFMVQHAITTGQVPVQPSAAPGAGRAP